MRKEEIMRKSTLYLNKVMECEAKEKVIAELKAEAREARIFLALNHGHRGIYLDDGEIQCGECKPNWDYKTPSLLTVSRVAMSVLLEKLSRLTALVNDNEAAKKVANYDYAREDAINDYRDWMKAKMEEISHD